VVISGFLLTIVSAPPAPASLNTILKRRAQGINQLPHRVTKNETRFKICLPHEAEIPAENQEISSLFNFSSCDLQRPK
jgi:hypothetical protein